MKLCVLGSSSSGNSVLASSGSTTVLFDAGFSARELGRRLAAAGHALAEVAAVCISHEHRDHTAGVPVLGRRHGIPVYANAGTVERMRQTPALDRLRYRVFQTGSPFEIGDLHIEPFSVPHDAADPVGFVVSAGSTRVGIATDLGMGTTLIRERLGSCRALVLESNHDEDMLRQSQRPWSLKQRIAGRQGHLSNRRAVEMLLEIAAGGVEHVFLAHLSEQCNAPEAALCAARRELAEAGWDRIGLSLTYPDRISEVWAG